MKTLKSSFKFPWLIAVSLALFSCAQTAVERDDSTENGSSAERSQSWHGIKSDLPHIGEWLVHLDD